MAWVLIIGAILLPLSNLIVTVVVRILEHLQNQARMAREEVREAAAKKTLHGIAEVGKATYTLSNHMTLASLETIAQQAELIAKLQPTEETIEWAKSARKRFEQQKQQQKQVDDDPEQSAAVEG
jgi:hypothetical protein